jgi:uncharacterized protein (DUF305 family)
MKKKLGNLSLIAILMVSLSSVWGATPDVFFESKESIKKVIETTKPYDRTFIDELTEHHKEGVMMAEMAVRKAHHPELKTLAEKMVMAQAQEIKMMQDWRKSWYPRAAEFENHSAGMRMERLEALSGEEFDIAFLDSMIMHHPGAIYLGHEAQSRGYHRVLINLAKKVSTSQIKELNQMRNWRYQWSAHDSEE